MKFGLFSDGVCPVIGYQLIREGQEAKLSLVEDDVQTVLLNVVPREKDEKRLIDWSDIVITDVGFLYEKIQKAKKAKKPWIGCDQFFEKFEDDRVFAHDEFTKLGLKVTDTIGFKDFRKAIEFVKKNPAPWVFKQNGQSARTLNYVGREDDGSDVISILENYESFSKDKKWLHKLWDERKGVDFALQKKVKGVEVATGGWWDGKQWSGLNLNFEHKKQYPGDVGPSTGEQGTVLMPIDKSHRLFKETTAKLEPLLKKHEYRTYCDLNCIVNEEGAWILEGTFRFGFPLVCLQTEAQNMKWSELLVKLSTGALSECPLKPGVTIGVVVSSPGYPYLEGIASNGIGIPILKIPKDVIPHFHPDQVVWWNGRFYTSGEFGMSFIVTANASTLDRAQKLVYDRIKSINAPSHGYRNDIGNRVREDMAKLDDWGFGLKEKVLT